MKLQEESFAINKAENGYIVNHSGYEGPSNGRMYKNYQYLYTDLDEALAKLKELIKE